MNIIRDEEIGILAFKLYKEDHPIEEMVWALAKVCKTLQINLDVSKDDGWPSLTAFKSVEDLKSKLLFNRIKIPEDFQIYPVAWKIYEKKPEKSKLHWYIAEKTLLLKKLEREIILENIESLEHYNNDIDNDNQVILTGETANIE